MSFQEVLQKLMTENGTSNVSLGKALGVSDVAVMRWKKGESVPSLDNAVAIAKFYGVSLDYLADVNKNEESTKFFRLPILGTVSAHSIDLYGIPKGEYIFTNVQETDGYPRHECYALKALDNSLEPEFSRNTMFFIHQQKQCADGDYVILLESYLIAESGQFVPRYTLRKFTRKDDFIELVSPNTTVKKMIFRKQEINNLVIEGVVIRASEWAG